MFVKPAGLSDFPLGKKESSLVFRDVGSGHTVSQMQDVNKGVYGEPCVKLFLFHQKHTYAISASLLYYIHV